MAAGMIMYDGDGRQPRDTGTPGQTGAQRPPESAGSEPEYGQRKRPEFGALASEYPGWNPYVYGPPDDATQQAASKNATAENAEQPRHAPAGMPASGGGQPWIGRANPSNGASRNGAPQNAAGPAGPHHLVNGINMDDPSQNPLYGHWDPYAIAALLLALLFPLPLLPAIMGGISMRRTRLFHMKGFGVALAAVIINVLWTILMIWMYTHGITTEELYQDMLSMLQNGGSSDGSSTVTT